MAVTEAWLRDPSAVVADMQIRCKLYPNPVHKRRVGVHRVLRATAPVTVSDVRELTSGELVILTETLTQRTALLALLGSESPSLRLETPAGYGLESIDMHLVFLDVTERRPSRNVHVDVREWTCPYVRVNPPAA